MYGAVVRKGKWRSGEKAVLPCNRKRAMILNTRRIVAEATKELGEEKGKNQREIETENTVENGRIGTEGTNSNL